MRVLVVGDIHEPWSHPGYRHFCVDLAEKYDCDHYILIGDVVDWGAISFHQKNPNAPAPKDEYKLALARVQKWVKVFPEADVCIGNHDERITRLAETVNIPEDFVRPYREIWKTPEWDWQPEFIVDDVLYRHGTGSAGLHPAFTSMTKQFMSTVQGHVHSAAGIKWRANPRHRIFGMDTGCGIDEKAIAFAYGRHQQVRSIISAGVVIDGIPYLEVMPMGRGEKYHRGRFR